MNQSKPLMITISRQMGSGGAYIGQQLAKALNIRYMDREIIQKAAEALSVTEEELNSRDERKQSFWDSFFQYNVFSPEIYVAPVKITAFTSLDLFHTQTEIIKELAEKQSSVIIGRCGFHILRDHPNCIRLFVHSDLNSRNKRVQALYHVSEKEAAEWITNSDKQRNAYVRNFTGEQWTDAQQYDLCINTGKRGMDQSVELILNYLKSH
jgi:CMP/dCMP kinase